MTPHYAKRIAYAVRIGRFCACGKPATHRTPQTCQTCYERDRYREKRGSEEHRAKLAAIAARRAARRVAA